MIMTRVPNSRGLNREVETMGVERYLTDSLQDQSLVATMKWSRNCPTVYEILVPAGNLVISSMKYF